jgi:serine/threonine-protein kinase RsbT
MGLKEDVPVRPDDAQLSQKFEVTAGNFHSAGDASATIKGMLKMLGIAPSVIRKVAIAAYEAELNLIIHSYGGQLALAVGPGTVWLQAADRGPGIADIQLALREGYSTAPESVRELGFGAGMGLPNMKRCASRFDIVSQLGKGTMITMAFDLA